VQDEDLESIGSPDTYPSFGPVFVDMAWNESIRWTRRSMTGGNSRSP